MLVGSREIIDRRHFSLIFQSGCNLRFAPLAWNQLNRLSYKRTTNRTMSKRKQHTAFLKALVLHGSAQAQVQLQDRLIRAERDEQCAWRALWLVAVLMMFSCCGIGYTAVLLPQFFHNSSHLSVKIFTGLGLASLMCAVAFLVCWVWCRTVLNRIQEECRRFIMAALEPASRAARSQFHVPHQELLAHAQQVVVDASSETSVSALPRNQTYAQLFSLRRAS